MTILLWLFGAVIALFLLTAFRGAPYVPSRRPDLANVFTELCPLTADDTVVDIGGGRWRGTASGGRAWCAGDWF